MTLISATLPNLRRNRITKTTRIIMTKITTSWRPDSTGRNMGSNSVTKHSRAVASSGESFQTPLATLHKFNGWADVFLVTPPGGLEDLYIQGTAKALGGKFSLIYHDFSAQTGGSDYGNELDFVASWSFMKNYSVLAKFALFDGDSSIPDINKFWLMLSANF